MQYREKYISNTYSFVFMNIDDRLALIKQVGEEILTEDELRTLLETKNTRLRMMVLSRQVEFISRKEFFVLLT